MAATDRVGAVKAGRFMSIGLAVMVVRVVLSKVRGLLVVEPPVAFLVRELISLVEEGYGAAVDLVPVGELGQLDPVPGGGAPAPTAAAPQQDKLPELPHPRGPSVRHFFNRAPRIQCMVQALESYCRQDSRFWDRTRAAW